MGLRLIDEEELLTYEGPGFKIFYRRLPNKLRAQIVDRHTKRGGTTNFTQASIDYLKYCVKGWEGVYIEKKGVREDIAFEPSKVELLPDLVQADLVDLIGANADEEAEDLGNSESTSGNSETMGA